MNIVIRKFSRDHKEVVLGLLEHKFKASCERYSCLPKKFTNRDVLVGYVEWMLNHHTGFVAIKDERVIGFLFGMFLDEMFYSKKGVYTPEWGFYMEEHMDRVNLMLLKALYDEMLVRDYLHHSISVMNNQSALEQFLFENAYGSRCMDANWKIGDEKEVDLGSFELVRAAEKHVEDLTVLLRDHHRYMLEAPTILGFTFDDEEQEVRKWLSSEKDVVWVLMDGDEMAGMMKTVIASSGGCDVCSDDQTLGVETTHLFDRYRGQNLGEKMLFSIYNHAKAQGFVRLAVDYETQNPSAQYFWKKYFTPTVRSLVRHIG
ncbi:MULTISPECIES: GNAT family N-acetyltransferase [unclassified Fusibacter]|uniref:GNAT family N-acetyltransferase n=1 Tax=unclassified Fusibacter TaxID=2624464 RepID=UPI00101024F4|nr:MULTISPECIES: GNAT family N-acetyltransferase [unclassified Fusibacter]MCK8061410.1 GNAT family N-acetyltransferase [Fusibacter sp. A2]NPE23547.1 GNAT family N-acetyltransferase [Fusibacter sp. A1]RXV58957.1 GNAT family N-acetyltransferase [Fusibacter sp. A1]